MIWRPEIDTKFARSIWKIPSLTFACILLHEYYELMTSDRVGKKRRGVPIGAWPWLTVQTRNPDYERLPRSDEPGNCYRKIAGKEMVQNGARCLSCKSLSQRETPCLRLPPAPRPAPHFLPTTRHWPATRRPPPPYDKHTEASTSDQATPSVRWHNIPNRKDQRPARDNGRTERPNPGRNVKRHTYYIHISLMIITQHDLLWVDSNNILERRERWNSVAESIFTSTSERRNQIW